MTPEEIRSELYFIKQRLSTAEAQITELRARTGQSVTTCAASQRCGTCGVPVESYQAYQCENPQCPRPRTLA